MMRISLAVDVSPITYEVISDIDGEMHLKFGWDAYIKESSKWIKIKTNIPEYSIWCRQTISSKRAYLYHQFSNDSQGKFVGYLRLERNPSFSIAKTAQDKLEIWTPSSYLNKNHRSLGLGGSLYRWSLDGGMILCADSDQSVFSNNLWKKLSKQYSYLICKADDVSRSLPIKARQGASQAEQKIEYFSNRDYGILLFGKPWTQDKVNTWAKNNGFLK